MDTYALNNEWDIYLDDFGNIATKSDKEQIAQDVASSARVFKGECLFDTERGVAYNEPDKIKDTLRFDIAEQAELIEGVSSANVTLDKIEGRGLTATIHLTTESGENIDVS